MYLKRVLAEKQINKKGITMKPNSIKCIWAACIAVAVLCITGGTASAQGNLGAAYISSVVGVNGECAVNTPTGQGDKWDIQAGGAYAVTLTGATDCDKGMDYQIGVVVHNSCGDNIYVLATQVDGQTGVYQFTVTIPSDTTCGCTMPIEYCTASGIGVPANNPGSGFFAQGYDGTAGDGKVGHLRVNTFDGSCGVTNCATQPTPTPTPCTGSITACKYYDFNANALKDSGEALLGWTFCLTSADGSTFTPVQQSSSDGSCTTFTNLPLGTYTVTEGSAGGTWTGSTSSQTVTVSQCAHPAEVDFGNYCTIPSGGLTLGFWSNKNGNKVLTGNVNGNGTTLLPGVVTLLNSLCLRNADGSTHTFTSSYGGFRTWLLGATATNMAYMLSAQLAALELDVAYEGVLGTSFDICSGVTISQLMTNAKNNLCSYGYTPSGNVNRPGQEAMKNCIDAINNGGPVVPAAPCDHSSVSVSCGQ
jgi:prealbumin domain-containing protein